MGQIWDFLRSVLVHFGSTSQNVLKLILKSPRFVPFGANLTQFWATPETRGLRQSDMCSLGEIACQSVNTLPLNGEQGWICVV